MKTPTIKQMDTRKTIRTMALPLIVMCASSLLHAEDLIHILKRGETLYGISRQYNVPADAIMEYNNLDNPDRLREGQKIRIPGVYTVARGDTLYGIARRFSIPVEELLSANKLARNSTIRIGDVLYLPGKSSSDSKPDNPVVVTAAPTVPLEDPRTYKTGKLDSTVIWPVEASEIAYLSGKLYGVSITADRNSEVKTIASGTVLSTGPYRGFGQVVFIQSKNGYIYVYGGLSRMNVRSGEKISFGDSLGTLGADSLSGKPQLYFMVYNKDKPVDPAKAPRG